MSKHPVNPPYTIDDPSNSSRSFYLFEGVYYTAEELAVKSGVAITRIRDNYRNYPELAETLTRCKCSYKEYMSTWEYFGVRITTPTLIDKLKISRVFFNRVVEDYGRERVQQSLLEGTIADLLAAAKKSRAILITCSDGKKRCLSDALAFDKVNAVTYKSIDKNLPPQDRFALAKKCTELSRQMRDEGYLRNDIILMLRQGDYKNAFAIYQHLKHLFTYITSVLGHEPSPSTFKRYTQLSAEELECKLDKYRPVIFSDGTSHSLEEISQITGISRKNVRVNASTGRLDYLEKSYKAGRALYVAPIEIDGRVWPTRTTLYEFAHIAPNYIESDENVIRRVKANGYSERLNFEAISKDVEKPCEGLWEYKCPVCGRTILCETEHLIDFKHDEDYCREYCVDEEVSNGEALQSIK